MKTLLLFIKRIIGWIKAYRVVFIWDTDFTDEKTGARK